MLIFNSTALLATAPEPDEAMNRRRGVLSVAQLQGREGAWEEVLHMPFYPDGPMYADALAAAAEVFEQDPVSIEKVEDLRVTVAIMPHPIHLSSEPLPGE